MEPRSSDEEPRPGAGGGGAGRGRRGRRDTGRLVESTQAEDRRMIALVAERPLLYARSSLPVASYYSQVKRLWQEVAALMNWTVAEVRRKWSHIRNSYSRHLRNEMHGMRTGRGRMVSRWYLADELEFLRQHMATDTRPSAYSVVSSFPPSLLQMEVCDEDCKPAPAPAEGPGGAGAGAWYAAPEPAPAPGPAGDDSCTAHSVEPDENSAYFQFFRGIYRDYQELTPKKQRYFRRKCLILLHGLVDGEVPGAGDEEGEGVGGGAGEGDGDGDGVVNLSCSGYTSDSEREQKLFVKDLKIVSCVSESDTNTR